MNDNVLVKMSTDGGFVAFSTYSRQIGRKGRFLFGVGFLREIMENDVTKYDKDCSNFVAVYRDGENVNFRFFWLSELSNGKIEGVRQTVSVPAAIIYYLIECNELSIRASAKHLSTPERGGAKINTKSAVKTIKNIENDKRKKRALSKAMRDCFQYAGETVCLFSDGFDDFYFVCETGWKINGGLILHKDKGGYKYAVHT